MIMMWSPPGASTRGAPGSTTKPSSFGRIVIAPSLPATTSCSSVRGEAEVWADTTVTGVDPVVLNVPNTAVIPDSAVLTHGSATVTAAAGIAAGARTAADATSDAAADAAADRSEEHT